MIFASSPRSGSGCNTGGAPGALVAVGWSKSQGSGVIGAEQFERQVGRFGQRRAAGQLLDLVARLDERTPSVSFAIPHPRICDGRGEGLEGVGSRGQVVDLRLCPRRAATQQGGNLEERRILWSVGRDLALDPQTAAGAVNAMSNAYVEINGLPAAEKDTWNRKLTYTQLK